MKIPSRLHFAFVLLCFAVGSIATLPRSAAAELGELRILFLGSERNEQFVDFLKEHVADVQSVERDEFQPEDAAKFDVVLLDWPQSSEARQMRTGNSPLGDRATWSRPTVLLGSAGLNLAVAWELRGGSGCTCLDPIAYDLRDHEISRSPLAIDRTATVTIPTPEAFTDDLEAESIDVIPLVEDFKANWRAGWCTYSTAFDIYPDVEFFCGGVNHKTPTAAAIWRQGNLLHFGFHQSPTELNETGRRLLLNSIVYISGFSEDRPIAITPSVFAGPNNRTRPRYTVASWLANPSRVGWVEDLVSESLWAEIESMDDSAKRVAWAKENEKFFAPDENARLTQDQDLMHFDLAFDDKAFFETMCAALESDDTSEQEAAERLLQRYVPEGPTSADAKAWRQWEKEHRPYLFATDYGHFRWYVDPLAKRRGVPTKRLRGADRMDRP